MNTKMKSKISTRTVERILSSALTQKSPARARLETSRRSDVTDEAQWSEDAAVAIRELDIVWTTQRQARAALSQLKAGQYGQCESCGRPIGEARLAALPWAIHCLRCAAIREHGKRAVTDPQGSPSEWLDDASDAA